MKSFPVLACTLVFIVPAITSGVENSLDPASPSGGDDRNALSFGRDPVSFWRAPTGTPNLMKTQKGKTNLMG